MKGLLGEEVKDCPWLLFEPNEKEGRKLLAGSSEIWSDAFAPAGRVDHFNLPRALPWAVHCCPFRA